MFHYVKKDTGEFVGSFPAKQDNADYLGIPYPPSQATPDWNGFYVALLTSDLWNAIRLMPSMPSLAVLSSALSTGNIQVINAVVQQVADDYEFAPEQKAAFNNLVSHFHLPITSLN